MALKGDMQPVQDSVDINFFMDSVAERGGIPCISTVSSGVNYDSSLNVAVYQVNPSGKFPVGVLQQDVVNKDLTQTHLDNYRDEVQVGGKVTMYRQGRFTTNFVWGTPTAGAPAYLGPSGNVSPTRQDAWTPQVGRFETTKDQNGYATIYVNIQ